MANDTYLTKLEQIVASIEGIYGLTAKSELGLEYWKADMTDVISAVSIAASGMSKENVHARNVAAGKQVVLLAYVKERMSYYKKKKLDFSSFPCMQIIAQILLAFTSRDRITVDSVKDLNKIVFIMSEIDAKDVKCRYLLSYRYLRIFIIMALYGNYCNASVIASLILEQIIVKGG